MCVLIALIGAGVLWWRQTDPLRRTELVLPISLLLFSLVLMGKIILLARITHYGFCLAMPASLLFIVAAWDWVPRTIERLARFGLPAARGVFGLTAGHRRVLFASDLAAARSLFRASRQGRRMPFGPMRVATK